MEKRKNSGRGISWSLGKRESRKKSESVGKKKGIIERSRKGREQGKTEVSMELGRGGERRSSRGSGGTMNIRRCVISLDGK